MIKFPDLHKEFVQIKDCSTRILSSGVEVLICPNCKNHVQQKGEHFHDCKEIIYKDELKDGKVETHCQCMCYSIEHGRRDE